MINEVFDFLKNSLNTYLEAGNSNQPGKVGFLGDEAGEALKFPVGQLTLLLVNIEEEKNLRPDDRFMRTDSDGARYQAPPVVHLNLYVMLVARFSAYLDSLKYLAAALRFFQANPVFTPEQYPSFPEAVPELRVELHTPTFTTQNEIWSMLKSPYSPSALYRLRMICVEEEMAVIPPVSIREVTHLLNLKKTS